MTRLAAGIERRDDEHEAAAIGARVCDRLRELGLTRRLGRRWVEVRETRLCEGESSKAKGSPETALWIAPE
jgi:hypothetical protein